MAGESGRAVVDATGGPSAPGSVQSITKMLPKVDDITFWLALNVVLFLYVGVLQLAFGFGPGAALSAGAIVISVVYLVLWSMSKTNKGMAHQWIMLVSALAVFGDVVYIAIVWHGAFTPTSVFLDFLGVMLFRATYKEQKAQG